MSFDPNHMILIAIESQDEMVLDTKRFVVIGLLIEVQYTNL